jgi:hypothetical protein
MEIKRGRPSIRTEMHTYIMNALSEKGIPMTTSTIAKTISDKIQRTISWNTAQKYIDELITLGKIEPVILPHSKDENREGLRVYTLKRS